MEFPSLEWRLIVIHNGLGPGTLLLGVACGEAAVASWEVVSIQVRGSQLLVCIRERHSSVVCERFAEGYIEF